MYRILAIPGHFRLFDNVNDAIDFGRQSIYINDAVIPDIIARVEEGETVTVTYGFSQIILEKVDEQ